MKHLSAIVLLFVVIVSCSKDDAPLLKKDSVDPIINDTTAIDTTTIIEIDVITDAEFAVQNFGASKTSNFIGKLSDIDSQPLEDVKITIANQAVLTDANGVFVLNEVAVNEKFAFIKAEKETYILGSRTIVPAANGSNFIDITLLKKNNIANVDSGEASEVSLSNGAKVTFGGSFVDASGAPYSGEVEVSMHYLEPNQTATFSQMPGTLFGKRENNEASAMETYGMLAINLYSPTGEVLNIAEDTPSEIRFPVSTTTPNAPSSIPLWYFDETVGYWKEQGAATKVNGEYVAEVSHFTWWNCDLAIETVELCFELKKDLALPNSYFTIKRTSNNQLVYSGNTNEQGINCGLIPKNETLSFSLLSDCGFNAQKVTQEIGPYTDDSSSVSIDINELIGIALTTFTATVRNCDNEPLVNGYAFVYTKNSVAEPKLLPIINGQIEQAFSSCKEGEYGVIVIDVDTGEVSDEIAVIINEDGITNLDLLQTCPGTGGGVFEGSITLTTQEEIETFGLLGYSEITGDIHIEAQQGIHSLASLSRLKNVGGQIFIRSSVESLTGLQNLQTVGSNFILDFNFNLTTIADLKNLTSVGGYLAFGINKNLSSLEGLDKLTSVGNIEIKGNDSLTSLAGLENLNTITEHLGIYSNKNLISLQGIEKIEVVGSLTIQDNEKLGNLNGLENISAINENLVVRGNTVLTALTGLENISTVGNIYIGNDIRPNPSLIDFCALTSLFTTGTFGTVVISDNKYNPSVNFISNGNCKEDVVFDGSITLTTQTEVDDFGAFGYIEVTGDLKIEDSGTLSINSLSNINSITKIGGSLIITNTPLTNLQGLENISTVGNIYIGNDVHPNPNLIDFCALTSLFTVGSFGAVVISDNKYNPSVNDISSGNCKEEAQSGGVFDGSITLSTQAEVDDFGAFGYIEVTGDIILDGQQTIVSVTSLSDLKTVGGNIYVKTSVQSLTGLENLQSVGGDFSFHTNYNLTSLSGLESLTSVGGSLWININESLTTLAGLESLTSVGYLSINSNENLTTLTGLENLTTINESLSVNNHLNLTNIEGLNNITAVGLDLTVQDNDQLTSITGLENLNAVARNVRINGNKNLSTLAGLENLTTIGDLLFIGNSFRPNNALADFCALTNLFTTGSHGNVTISNNRYNPSVSDILNGNCERTGLSGEIYEGSITLYGQDEVDDFALFAYSEVTGDLTITNQATNSIVSLAGLNHLSKIGGTFKIQYTPLTSLQGLENLSFIGDNFTIDTNNNLTSLSGLEGLTTIQGRYVNIIDNSNLTSLAGLNNLTTINGLLGGPNGVRGQIYIDSNDNLTSLAGMESFTEILGHLVISRNQSLTSLQGFNNLTSIQGRLSIYENGITSLNGLENLNSVGETITIGARFAPDLTMLSDGNPSLVDFCAITNLITNGYYDEVLIERNAYNPTVSDISNGNCAQ